MRSVKQERFHFVKDRIAKPDVEILDRAGNPVPNLAPEDFVR